MESLHPSLFPVQIAVDAFSCSYNASDPRGMEIADGDDHNGTIDKAFRDEMRNGNTAFITVNSEDELVNLLANDFTVGVATRKDTAFSVIFDYEWSDEGGYAYGIHTRVVFTDIEVADFIFEKFQKMQYNPYADAQDYRDTENSKYGY